MCPPTYLHVYGLDNNVQKLLIDVYGRPNFGIGASPGGRNIYITFAIREKLVESVGYYPRTGQQKFRLTSCGKRVAKYLIDSRAVADSSLVDMAYDSGTCPLETRKDFDIRDIGYHDYEHWNEKRFRRNPNDDGYCEECGHPFLR